MRLKNIDANFKITTEKNKERIADLLEDCPVKEDVKKEEPKKEEVKSDK